MTTVKSLVPEPFATPKKASDQLKENIAQQRQQIAQMESELGKLHRQLSNRHNSGRNGQPVINKEAIYKEITRLEGGISNLQAGVEVMQRRLPLLIASENAAEQMDREIAEKERQQAAADRAQHDAAVKAAALAQWLQVPGQTQAGFESAWPTIASQIAMQAAVAAGSAESTVRHDSPMRIAAINALAISYGRKEVKPL